MDLRQLSYFLSLYEEGSTTRAARRMNVVQPALSMQISKLEDEFGQKLFERSAQGMTPTSAGVLAYQLFSPLLRDFSDAKRQIASRSGGISGRIAAGVVASVTTSVLASTLATVSREYPGVEVSVCDGYSTTHIDQVRGGVLDFAIVNKRRRRLDLPSIDLLHEEMVLVAKANSERDLPSPVLFRDLAGLPLVLPSKSTGLRNIIDDIADQENVELSVRLEVDAVAAIEGLIRQSDLLTILPTIAVHRSLQDGSLRAHRIIAPRVIRQLICVHNPRRPLSEASRLLVEVITRELVAAAEVMDGYGAD